MRSVEEHLVSVLEGVVPLEPVDVPLLDAVGQTLAADVVAPWPLPPFDNSSMDGYAVLASDVAAATPESPVVLSVSGDLAAGTSGGLTVTPGTTLRIMTGAPLPDGADAVVPVEQTDGGTGRVEVRSGVATGSYVRREGEDVAVGSAVMRAGDVVTVRSIAVLASVGRASVTVVRRPRVVVLSTGDELVEPGTPLTRGKITESNGTMLTALCRAAGAVADRAPIVRDRDEDVLAALENASRDADLIVTSGGVSMGAYDTVKAVLSRTGEVEFTKVAQHPGMPQGAGRVGAGRIPIITLPGNPVSSFVSFELYVRPVICRLLGRSEITRRTEPAECLAAFDSPPGKAQYVRGVLEVRPDGSRAVRPVGAQGSHVVGALAEADALILVPVGVSRVEVADTVTVIDLDR